MSRFRISHGLAAFAIMVVCLISFGLIAPSLDVFWDDWPSLWYLHFFGPTFFPNVFALDRPLLGQLFVLTTSLFGESILVWQFVGIFFRFLSGLALWWTLRLLWPRHGRQVIAMALLLVVFPSFRQQYIPVSYSHHFMVLSLFLFSLGTMVLALRTPRWFWPLTAISILASTLSMLTKEFFVGLEFLRPVFIYLSLNDEEEGNLQQRIRRMGMHWLPYALILLFYLIWKATGITTRATVDIFDKFTVAPLETLSWLAQTIVGDIFEVVVLSWKATIDFSTFGVYNADVLLRYVLVVLATAIFAIVYLLGIRSDGVETESENRIWSTQAIIVGLFALLIGGLPVWPTNLHIDLFFPWDRFTLPMMVGASILSVGLIERLTHNWKQSAVILGIALGLAAGMHYRVAVTFRQEWLMQKEFFWQLVWRAPGIEPGTLLLTSDSHFPYSTDNSLTAPLNWIYAPATTEPRLTYLLYDISLRLGGGLPGLEEGLPVHEPYRATPFDGTTSQALLVAFSPPDCLKVIDPVFDRRIPDKPSHFREALPLSKPDLIRQDAAYSADVLTHFWGPEPEHDWCYSFQKAELARQMGDWQQVVHLGDQAGITNQIAVTRSLTEAAPFIEGYAHAGRWKKAYNLTIAYNADEKNVLMLCDLWARISQTVVLDAEGQDTLDEIRNALQCAAP